MSITRWFVLAAVQTLYCRESPKRLPRGEGLTFTVVHPLKNITADGPRDS